MVDETLDEELLGRGEAGDGTLVGGPVDGGNGCGGPIRVAFEEVCMKWL